MSKKIGIDLGTTYSCVSYVDDTGVIRIVDNIEGEQTTPSVVYFDSDGSAVVGSTAKAEGAMEPENIVERVKNFMGDPDYRCHINGQEYSAAAVSTIILTKLIKDTELALGDEIEGAIITCPAYFGEGAKNATKIAGESVMLSNGQPLNVYRILEEPVAAAEAYAFTKNEDMDKTLLIYDLGGGTFDCTIVKLKIENGKKQMRVITTGGDHQLGGKDWDAAFAELVRQKFCEATGADIDAVRDDPESKAWFSENIEKAKKNLTSRESTSLTPSFDGSKERIEVTRDEFDSVTGDLLDRTISMVNDMMKAKGMSMDTVDEIILVGGSTYMPQVKTRLEKEYPGKPLIQYEPNKAVAMGAAYMAAFSDIEYGNDGQDKGEQSVPGGSIGGIPPVITTCTKSYGLRIVSGGENKVLNLVIKDTPKPAVGHSSDHFPLTITGDPAPVDDVNILILESDSLEELAPMEDCNAIYEDEPIKFDGAVPGDHEVSVDLSVDENGIVSLALTDKVTGKTYTMQPKRIGDESVEEIKEITKGITLR